MSNNNRRNFIQRAGALVAAAFLYYTTLPNRQPDKKIDNALVYPETPSPLMGTFGIYFSKIIFSFTGIFNFTNG